MTEAGDGIVQRMLRRADDVQRAHPTMAFPFAVIKKFGDDRASQLAALIAYYGFFSLFPLLLVFATVAAFVLAGDPDLQQRLIDSILEQFPVVGTEIGEVIDESVRQLSGSPLALTIGIVGALWTGTAVVAAAQRAMDDIWDVPRAERPGLLGRVVRAFLLFFVFAASILLSTFLTEAGTATGLGHVLVRGISIVGLVLVSVAVFAFAYRVLTVATIAWRQVLPGAVVAAIGWTALLLVGQWIVERQIGRASAVYGLFATVIGLLAWIYLAAQLFLVAGEVNVVRARRLWPRSLAPASLAPQDREVLAGQAEEQRALPEERVDVTFGDDAGGEGEG
ncbi:MAG TPA: YihY/virulence factor BrkB family protein [Actinomycetota bacterium]|nr:YihY/virulence factor BrkB family protein [Actinomycetota bacterium]